MKKLSLEQRVLIRPRSWARALQCIVPYFHLIGSYCWLGLKYRVLWGENRSLKLRLKLQEWSIKRLKRNRG